MRYIHSVFISPVDSIKTPPLVKWLKEKYYPYAIDRTGGKVIAFNVPLDKIIEFVKTLNSSDFTIELKPRPHHPYHELYQYVDRGIGGNAMLCTEYFRRLYHGQAILVPMIHGLVLSAYFEENYADATEARRRISEDLYGIDADSLLNRFD